MTLSTEKLSLQAFLRQESKSDCCYELVDGDLVPMPLGTGLHGDIIKFLSQQFDDEAGRLGLDYTALQASVGIQSPRGTRWDTCRIPDVTVLRLEQWQSLRTREAVIALNQPPPQLVVEVVSETTQSTDYRAKRAEYSVLDIPEYWIVDPIRQCVTICLLLEGLYESVEFAGLDSIESKLFAELQLTATQVLQAHL